MISKFKGDRLAIYDKVKNDTVEKLGGSVARNNELNSLRKDRYRIRTDGSRYHDLNDARHEAKMHKKGATREEILINKIADNKAKLAVMDHDAKKHASISSRLKRAGLIALPIAVSSALGYHASRYVAKHKGGLGGLIRAIGVGVGSTAAGIAGAKMMARRTEHMRNPHKAAAYESRNKLRTKLLLAEHELKNMK